MLKAQIFLKDIDKKKVSGEATHEDSWVFEVLKESFPEYLNIEYTPDSWAKAATFKVQAEFEKMAGEYFVRGSLEAQLQILCPRCGEKCFVTRATTFHSVFKMNERGEVASDDPDFILLDRPVFEFQDYLIEQLVSLEPMVEQPEFSLDFQRHECMNLKKTEKNEGDEDFAGQGNGKRAESPFAILNSLKGRI